MAIKHKHVLYGRFTPSSIPPQIILWLIKKHIVKSEAQAITLMFVIMLVCIGLTAFNLLYMQKIWAFFNM